MLRNILIISGGGIVLFRKEFINAIPNSNLIGSLLLAILELSFNVTGLKLTGIHFSQVSVTLVQDKNTKNSCAVFYDSEDTHDFGRLCGYQFLYSFLKFLRIKRIENSLAFDLNVTR